MIMENEKDIQQIHQQQDVEVKSKFTFPDDLVLSLDFSCDEEEDESCFTGMDQNREKTNDNFPVRDPEPECTTTVSQHKSDTADGGGIDFIQPISQRLKVAELHPKLLKDNQKQDGFSDTKSEQSINNQDEDSPWNSEFDEEEEKNKDSRVPDRDRADVGLKVIMQKLTYQHQPSEHKQRSVPSAQPDSIQSLSQRLKVAEPHPHFLQTEQYRAGPPDTNSEQGTNNQDEDEDSPWDSESDDEEDKGNENSRVPERDTADVGVKVIMQDTGQHQSAERSEPSAQPDSIQPLLQRLKTADVGVEIQLHKSGTKTQIPAKSEVTEEKQQSFCKNLSPPQRNMACADVICHPAPNHHPTLEFCSRHCVDTARPQVQIHSSSTRKLVHQAMQTVDIPTHKQEEAWTQTEGMEKILHNFAEYKAMQQKLQKRNVSLRRKLNKANGQCAAKQGAYEELQERFTCTLKRRFAKEENRLQLYEERIKILEREKAHLQQLNSTLERETAEREVLVRKLQQDLAESQKKLASLDVTTRQCSDLQKERDALLKDVERFSGKLQEREEQHPQVEKCQKEGKKHLEEALQSMNIENNYLKATVQQLATSVEQLQDGMKAAAAQAAAQQVQEEKIIVAVGSTVELEQHSRNDEDAVSGLTSVDKNLVLQEFDTEFEYIRQRYGDVDSYKRMLNSKFNKVEKQLVEFRNTQLKGRQQNEAFIHSTRLRADHFLRESGWCNIPLLCDIRTPCQKWEKCPA